MNLNDSTDFNVNLSDFNGPLDVLLDLAKSQKVNLEKISVTKLADQFHNFITKTSMKISYTSICRLKIKHKKIMKSI